MRKKKQTTRCTKLKLEKCRDLCRYYDKVQGAYARKLSADSRVKEYAMNVPQDYERVNLPEDIQLPQVPYTTDFLVWYVDGGVAVREAVYRKLLSRPSVIEGLELSRLYWLEQGIEDWKIVVEEVPTLEGE